MEKEQITAAARSLADAALQAQDWISRNNERVKDCGQNSTKVLAELRKQRRLLRRLERAAQRKMCAGVFGPSQAGKSYLLSSLAANSEKKVPCIFGSQEYDFMRDLNPGGGEESTGLVTRFTMTAPAGITDEYPVHVRLFSETELVKIFANSYFSDNKKTAGVSEDADTNIKNTLAKLKIKANNSESSITLDDMEDLREYINTFFADKAQTLILNQVYWNDAIELAPKLSLEDRAKLYGIIWDNIPEFTEMFLSLAKDLKKLGNPEEAFFEMAALDPREASIINVKTLDGKDFSQFHVGSNIKIRSPQNVTMEISRKNATAIVAELTLVMKNQPADYFAHTDLLDFPGYKGRLDGKDIAEYLHEDPQNGKVEQFFKRGKVSYLFQRYTIERELTSLLLCVARSDDTQGLPSAVEEWIISSHGKTPQDRLNTQNALFYILTQSDRHFDDKDGIKFETHWDGILNGQFINLFSGIRSQNTKWVEEWTPKKPFSNLFMLRSLNVKWDAMMVRENEMEIKVRPDKQEFANKMQQAFIKSNLVNKHFQNPELSFTEIMKINDGGINHIKNTLKPVCNPDLKLKQVVNALNIIQENLSKSLSLFYSSGNKEEELKKKLVLFGAFGKLFANPNFQERFPELLSKFKMPPDQLFYLYGDAERAFIKHRETFATPINNEDEEDMLNADAPVAELEDVLSFFDEPAAPEPGQSKAYVPTEMDESHFYAEEIIDAWKANMKEIGESKEVLKHYYLFPPNIFEGIKSEFAVAIERNDICGKLEKKFREIGVGPGDVHKESIIRKQASYAIGVLNDFISWLGKKPADTSESERHVQFQGKDVAVFRDQPPIDEYPKLSETYAPSVRQWYKDWLTTFYGMLVDNVTFDGGTQINLEENARIGAIVKQINETRVNQ